MSALTTYTHELTTDQAAKLRECLAQQHFEWLEKPHCLYAAVKGKVNVSVYAKGPKVLIQGKGTEDLVKMTLEPLVLGCAELGYEEVNHPEWFQPHLGVDESGKGDFFGPLVIAGVYVDAEVVHKLRDIGVVDSKRVTTDGKIHTLAEHIRQVPGLRFEVIQIHPEKYNDLYAKFGNLNKLLAWGHAKVIELLLERVPDCPRALSDQFANAQVLQKALQKRGRTIQLEQRTKAESDPAVAAASILARDGFVRWLEQNRLGNASEALPRGVSENVRAVAREIFESHGALGLRRLVKMHFKTASEVMGTDLTWAEPEGMS
jgi:ribonuclease HIII